MSANFFNNPGGPDILRVCVNVPILNSYLFLYLKSIFLHFVSKQTYIQICFSHFIWWFLWPTEEIPIGRVQDAYFRSNWWIAHVFLWFSSAWRGNKDYKKWKNKFCTRRQISIPIICVYCTHVFTANWFGDGLLGKFVLNIISSCRVQDYWGSSSGLQFGLIGRNDITTPNDPRFRDGDLMGKRHTSKPTTQNRTRLLADVITNKVKIQIDDMPILLLFFILLVAKLF